MGMDLNLISNNDFNAPVLQDFEIDFMDLV